MTEWDETTGIQRTSKKYEWLTVKTGLITQLLSYYRRYILIFDPYRERNSQ